MPTLKAVHRPHKMEEALALLNREDVTTAVLAGGTTLVPKAADAVDELVDLQALALGGISHAGVQMKIGATTTLQELVDDEAAPDILRNCARYEGPNTFRNAGTIGGVVAAGDRESELLAAFLVCNTAVTVQYATHREVFPLPELLADRSAKLKGGIITGISLQKPTAAAHERVARTPQDKPIVAAVAAKTSGGEPQLALCGVAGMPLLVTKDALSTLDPPGDFRGSSTYRQAMAKLLAGRVLAKCG
jgi:CO/xanthine dehydrogenase FAD-binding subunit